MTTQSSTIETPRDELPRSERHTRDAALVGKAASRAAALLKIPPAELARILDVPEREAAELESAWREHQPTDEAFENALVFIRLYRSLLSIVGADRAAITWLNGPNLHFNARPRDLLTDNEGLCRVVGYLDAHRGII